MPNPSISDALSVLPAKINLFRVEFTSCLPDPWPLLNVRKSPPAGGVVPSNVTLPALYGLQGGRRGEQALW